MFQTVAHVQALTQCRQKRTDYMLILKQLLTRKKATLHLLNLH